MCVCVCVCLCVCVCAAGRWSATHQHTNPPTHHCANTFTHHHAADTPTPRHADTLTLSYCLELVIQNPTGVASASRRTSLRLGAPMSTHAFTKARATRITYSSPHVASELPTNPNVRGYESVPPTRCWRGPRLRAFAARVCRPHRGALDTPEPHLGVASRRQARASPNVSVPCRTEKHARVHQRAVSTSKRHRPYPHRCASDLLAQPGVCAYGSAPPPCFRRCNSSLFCRA